MHVTGFKDLVSFLFGENHDRGGDAYGGNTYIATMVNRRCAFPVAFCCEWIMGFEWRLERGVFDGSYIGS